MCVTKVLNIVSTVYVQGNVLLNLVLQSGRERILVLHNRLCTAAVVYFPRFITALHVMQMRYSDENAVRPSQVAMRHNSPIFYYVMYGAACEQ